MDALTARQYEFERAWLYHEFQSKSVARLAELIGREKHRLINRPGRGRRPNYTFPLLSLDDNTLASLTTQAVAREIAFCASDTQPSYIDVAQSIRDMCYWCWTARRARGDDLPDIVALLATSSRYRGRNRISRIQQLNEAVAQFEARDWRSPEGDSLGGVLLEFACAIGIVYSVVQPHSFQETTIRRIYPSIELASALKTGNESLRQDEVSDEISRWIARPMLVPPKPWTNLYDGGFLTASEYPESEIACLVKHRSHNKRRVRLEEAVDHIDFSTVCVTVNALQETAWRLNHSVYSAIGYALEHIDNAPGLPNLTELKRLKRKESVLPDETLAAWRQSLFHCKPLLAWTKVFRWILQAGKPVTADDVAEWIDHSSGATEKTKEDGAIARKRRHIVRSVKPLLELMCQHGLICKSKGGRFVPTSDISMEKVLTFDSTSTIFDAEWQRYHHRRNAWERIAKRQRSIESQQFRFEILWKLCAEIMEETVYLGEDGNLNLYFPYQLDYRGRAYSMVSILSPQGSDVERGLLEFAEGKIVDDVDKYWLGIHLANTYGKTKLTFEQRLEWCEENANLIHDLARLRHTKTSKVNIALIRPSDQALDFWRQADKPWQFLAACFEWVDKDTPGFMTHIPIALDASANGLQHLSALARDRSGADVTNLLPGNQPRDIYQQVADHLSQRIDQKARNGDSQALQWQGKITRDTVKRPVMTTPYGVTTSGIQKQIESYLEKLLEDSSDGVADEDRLSPTYLGNEVARCIEESLSGPSLVMKWLKYVTAFVYQNAGVGVEWKSPAGFPVVVEEYKEDEKRISILLRIDSEGNGYEAEKRLEYPVKIRREDFGIDLARQRNSIVPNFIHSIDAAHMMLAISRLRGEGLRHFAVIHDSYGVHAPDVPAMLTALKEEFVRVHRAPLLKEFLTSQLELIPGLSALPRATELLDECPDCGDLDIEFVLHSKYMFA